MKAEEIHHHWSAYNKMFKAVSLKTKGKNTQYFEESYM